MPTINDANGQPANVNEMGHLETEAITHSAEHYANEVAEQAYQIPFAVNPAGAGDCIFYIKNNSESNLFIEGFSYTSSAAEEIYVEIANTGTAVLTSGAALTPNNCNAGSGKTTDVTCWSNIGDGAVDITGLVTGREVERIWITAAADNKYHNFVLDIVIPKNKAFTIWCVGGDTNIRGTVFFYYHS